MGDLGVSRYPRRRQATVSGPAGARQAYSEHAAPGQRPTPQLLPALNLPSNAAQARWLFGVLQCSRGLLRNFNLANESIPDRRHGGDVARLPDVISQRAAQLRDAARERAFCDGSVSPYRVQQLLLRDEFLRVVEKE